MHFLVNIFAGKMIIYRYIDQRGNVGGNALDPNSTHCRRVIKLQITQFSLALVH